MPLDDPTMFALLAPEYRAYVERIRARGDRALDRVSVAESRRRMRANQTAGLPADVTAEHHGVDDFSVRIIRPAGSGEGLPVVVYYHGGGWVLGDFDTHARLAGTLAVASGCAVLFVEYGRAPEVRYPLPLEQCYRALAWVAEQGARLGLDSTRLMLAGDSAGGNLAVSVAMLSARRGGPELRLQALIYPIADCDFETASYRDFETGLNLDAAAMRWFWDQYVPDACDRSQPLASPLRAPIDELRNLPSTLVITSECDVLRDEGESLARRLAEAGVPVASVRFNGVVHGFLVADELASSTQAISAVRLLAAHIREAAEKR